ncbi:hypothetical protein K438DRAFT_1815410 [Mycena galopus ATCC 62051]|nr:hypothetical protein K438DRAFT_1815410 [Mycena galopus ATCC 62051]
MRARVIGFFSTVNCGHTTQVENRSNSEEDGMDECLVPVDGEEHKIVDNELRRHLVEALPPGSSLVAVFDSCHSASLLDLAHFRCNRVYVPWRSKGRRRSDDRWNAVVRRLAMPFLPPSKPPTPVASRAPSRSASRVGRLSRSNTHASARALTPSFSPMPLQPAATNKPALPKDPRNPNSVAEAEDELEPIRPNTPLAASEHHDVPLVASRRIYEAARTAQGRLRAWRTDVDALEVTYQNLATGGGNDGEGPKGDGGEGEGAKRALARAGTEGEVRARGGGQKSKQRRKEQEAADGSQERAPRKRASLPLVPLRLGSFIAGLRAEPEQEEAESERRTAVTRARAVSVAVREDSGSGAGKENVIAGTRPTLSVAVPQTRPTSWLGEEGEECESPSPVWSCTGWTCRDPAHGHDDEEKASVISFSSCQDHQISWEDSSGGSMTQELVRILERDPHPTLRSLVTRVSHALHDMTLQRHLDTRRYKRDLKRYKAYLENQRMNAALHRPGSSGSPGNSASSRRAATKDSASRMSTLPSTPGATASVSRTSSAFPDLVGKDSGEIIIAAVRSPNGSQSRSKSEGFLEEPTLDMVNFQDPQVASHYPLNMEQEWCM